MRHNTCRPRLDVPVFCGGWGTALIRTQRSSANGIMDETCMVEVVGTAVVSPAKRLDLEHRVLHIRRLWQGLRLAHETSFKPPMSNVIDRGYGICDSDAWSPPCWATRAVSIWIHKCESPCSECAGWAGLAGKGCHVKNFLIGGLGGGLPRGSEHHRSPAASQRFRARRGTSGACCRVGITSPSFLSLPQTPTLPLAHLYIPPSLQTPCLSIDSRARELRPNFRASRVVSALLPRPTCSSPNEPDQSPQHHARNQGSPTGCRARRAHASDQVHRPAVLSL